jgi:hypothetical protein
MARDLTKTSEHIAARLPAAIARGGLLCWTHVERSDRKGVTGRIFEALGSFGLVDFPLLHADDATHEGGYVVSPEPAEFRDGVARLLLPYRAQIIDSFLAGRSLICGGFARAVLVQVLELKELIDEGVVACVPYPEKWARRAADVHATIRDALGEFMPADSFASVLRECQSANQREHWAALSAEEHQDLCQRRRQRWRDMPKEEYARICARISVVVKRSWDTRTAEERAELRLKLKRAWARRTFAQRCAAARKSRDAMLRRPEHVDHMVRRRCDAMRQRCAARIEALHAHVCGEDPKDYKSLLSLYDMEQLRMSFKKHKANLSPVTISQWESCTAACSAASKAASGRTLHSRAMAELRKEVEKRFAAGSFPVPQDVSSRFRLALTVHKAEVADLREKIETCCGGLGDALGAASKSRTCLGHFEEKLGRLDERCAGGQGTGLDTAEYRSIRAQGKKYKLRLTAEGLARYSRLVASYLGR